MTNHKTCTLTFWQNLATGALIAGTLASCSAASEETISEQPELSIGATGAEVEALNSYLLRRGYVPNPALAQEYPNWRPLHNHGPNDISVFDEHTERALQTLQANAGLKPTGTLTPDTIQLMQAPRCAHPESADLAPEEKHALYPWSWQKQTITWAFSDAWDADSCSTAEFRQAAAAAFGTWGAGSRDYLSFEFIASGTPDILIYNTPGGDLASGGPDALSGNTVVSAKIGVNRTIDWSCQLASDALSGAQFDFQTVMTHEIGHVLGFQHGLSIYESIMRPAFAQREIDRSLDINDITGIRQRYTDWTTTNLEARDIDGDWLITNTPNHAPGNYKVGKRINAELHLTNSSGSRIAVGPEGRPWLVRANGTIYQFTTNDPATGVWEERPGCATDIGANEQDIWILGCSADANGDRLAYRWETFHFVHWTGEGKRISVGPTGPWVVKANGEVWRRIGGSHQWTYLRGDMTGTADIAVAKTATGEDPFGFACVTGDAVPRGGGARQSVVRLWNAQPFDLTPDTVDDTPLRPRRNNWERRENIADLVSCSISAEGEVMVIDSNFELLREKVLPQDTGSCFPGAPCAGFCVGGICITP